MMLTTGGVRSSAGYVGVVVAPPPSVMPPPPPVPVPPPLPPPPPAIGSEITLPPPVPFPTPPPGSVPPAPGLPGRVPPAPGDEGCVRMVHVNDCEADKPLVFATVAVTLYAPGLLGVPEMRPVLAAT